MSIGSIGFIYKFLRTCPFYGSRLQSGQTKLMENILKSPNDKRPLGILFKLLIGIVFHLLPRTHPVWYDFHR